MSGPIPIVLQMQADAVDSRVSASYLLRKAKIAATKLNLQDFLQWIDKELNGYTNTKLKDLPDYRNLRGHVKFLNPYQGWRPVFFADDKDEEIFSRVPVIQSIGSVEETIRSAEQSGYLTYPLTQELAQALFKSMRVRLEPAIHISYGQVWSIVDAVRNNVLNWSLELEKVGVLGEGMRFTENDKREASNVANHFFAHNIGVVGNVTDHAIVYNQQTSTVTSLDLSKAKEIVSQARQAVALLPDDKKDEVSSVLDGLDNELMLSQPNEAKIQGFFQTLRTICEGAAGNLAAEGILGLLAKISGLDV